MQAGLVTKPLSFSDIFTARGFSLRVFVAVVCVSLSDHVTESDAAELPRFSWPSDQGEWLPDQQRMAQAPSSSTEADLRNRGPSLLPT